MNKNPKILILRLSAIGDTVHTLPVAYLIKKFYPNAFIGWVVEDRAAALLVNNPLIDKVHVMPKSVWKKRGFSFSNIIEFWKLIFEIRKEKYDISLDIQELLKSGVVGFLSGAKRRLAHKGAREHADIFANEKLPYSNSFDTEKHVIERNLEFLSKLGMNSGEKFEFILPPVSEENKKYVGELLKNLDNNKKTVLFSPATTWQTKHWPVEYWVELYNSLKEKFNIIFTGTEKEKVLIDEILKDANPSDYIDLAGKTNIEQFVEVVNYSDVMVSPDSGSAHIASAAGKPVIISIFGPTAYKRNAPFGEKHLALSCELTCQPCFKKKCLKSHKTWECMYRITPKQILENIELLFNK